MSSNPKYTNQTKTMPEIKKLTSFFPEDEHFDMIRKHYPDDNKEEAFMKSLMTDPEHLANILAIIDLSIPGRPGKTIVFTALTYYAYLLLQEREQILSILSNPPS